MRIDRPAFRYLFDPVCVGSIVLYALNRWLLKPHGIGGEFTHGYLNDVLCLPLFTPIILGIQRRLNVREHDAAPRVWELLQHGIVFSVLFEVMLPRWPRYFQSVADPLDVLAYFAGGLAAKLYWAAADHRVRSYYLKSTTALRTACRPGKSSAGDSITFGVQIGHAEPAAE